MTDPPDPVHAALVGAVLVVHTATEPSAALAGSRDGRPVVMCSAQGPKTIRVGGDGDQTSGLQDARCAFCIMAPSAALPPPSPPQVTPVIRPVTVTGWVAAR